MTMNQVAAWCNVRAEMTRYRDEYEDRGLIARHYVEFENGESYFYQEIFNGPNEKEVLIKLNGDPVYICVLKYGNFRWEETAA